MIKIISTACILMLTATGNTQASASWKILAKAEATENYCTQKFSDQKKLNFVK